MLRTVRDGIVFYRFAKLDNESDVDQAVFTRLGGVSQEPFASLNLGHTVGDDLQAVTINHQRALAALDWQRQDVATCYQVHSAQVGVVGMQDRGRVRPKTDAILTNKPGVMLMQRFADCAPVMFFDPKKRVIGLAHAGWRGIVAGVLPATVKTLVENFGSRPVDVWAGIGPAIGVCCYEVGQDVVDKVQPGLNGNQAVQQMNGKLYLDIVAAAQGQLAAAGVEQIETAGICTACQVDEWFSHRAEKGKTGRFGVVIGLRSY